MGRSCLKPGASSMMTLAFPRTTRHCRNLSLRGLTRQFKLILELSYARDKVAGVKAKGERAQCRKRLCSALQGSLPILHRYSAISALDCCHVQGAAPMMFQM